MLFFYELGKMQVLILEAARMNLVRNIAGLLFDRKLISTAEHLLTVLTPLMKALLFLRRK